MSFALRSICKTVCNFIKNYSTLEIYTDGSSKDGFKDENNTAHISIQLYLNLLKDLKTKSILSSKCF